MTDLGERGVKREGERKREVSERETKGEKERDGQRRRETASMLDIARGSVRHWRTSPWSTTVATPNLFSFLDVYLCLAGVSTLHLYPY